jgi:hypothetical protein
MTEASTDDRPWPCATAEQRIKPCWALSEVLQQRGRGTKFQGLELQTLVNMKTFKHSRDMVVLKSGKHGKNGLALNLCPFCGEKLQMSAEPTSPVASADRATVGGEK